MLQDGGITQTRLCELVPSWGVSQYLERVLTSLKGIAQYGASQLGRRKAESFQAGGFPFFSEKAQIVSQTLSELFLVGAVKKLRRGRGTNEEITENIRKVPKMGD